MRNILNIPKNRKEKTKRSQSANNKIKFKVRNNKKNNNAKNNTFRDIVSLISNMNQEIEIK